MTTDSIKAIARWWRFCRVWYRIGALEQDLAPYHYYEVMYGQTVHPGVTE